MNDNANANPNVTGTQEELRDELLNLQQAIDVELDPSSDLYRRLKALIGRLQAALVDLPPA